jgi:hypothetical protein
MQLHKLEKAKDKHFWSVRVSADILLIVHRTESSLLLCYVDHHDAAYRWAERRRTAGEPPVSEFLGDLRGDNGAQNEKTLFSSH